MSFDPGTYQPTTRGARSDAHFNPRPLSAAIASLSEKLSDTILAATLKRKNTSANFMRFATVGTWPPPTKKMIAEYAMRRKRVSVAACLPQPMGFRRHHDVVLFKKLLYRG